MKKWILFFLIFVNIAYTKETHIELAELSNEIQNLKQTISFTAQQKNTLEQQLMETEISLGNLNHQLQQFNQILFKEQCALTQLKRSQKKLKHQLALEQETLRLQLISAYQLKQTAQWKILMNGENVNTTSRHLIYYRYLSEARLKLLNTMQQTLSDLQNTIETARKAEQTVKNLLQQKKWQQDEQKALVQKRQALVNTLNFQTKTKQDRLAILLATQKALQKVIADLAIKPIEHKGFSFKQLKHQLHWPVKGHMIAAFGSLMDVGNQSLTGVIIKTTPGNPVQAIYSGKVIFADWLRGLGLLVIINHGDNYMSLYARNQTLYAKVGTLVKTGDIIAAAGNTGGYDKTSLYFEIRENGIPVNPKQWCH